MKVSTFIETNSPGNGVLSIYVYMYVYVFANNQVQVICFDKHTLQHYTLQAPNLFQHFLTIYYNFKLIYNEFRNVWFIDRNNLLRYENNIDTDNLPNMYILP